MSELCSMDANYSFHSACSVEALTETPVVTSVDRFRQTSLSVRFGISAGQQDNLEYFEVNLYNRNSTNPSLDLLVSEAVVAVPE